MDDDDFLHLKFSVDNIMKKRESARIGNVSGVSSPISHNEEERMWQAGVLGEDEPTKLRNMVMFLLGIHCALRGGRTPPSLVPAFRFTVQRPGRSQKWFEICLVQGRQEM